MTMEMYLKRGFCVAALGVLSACTNLSEQGPTLKFDVTARPDEVRDCIQDIRHDDYQIGVAPYRGGWLITQTFSGVLGPTFTGWTAQIAPMASGSHIIVHVGNTTTYEDQIKPCIDKLSGGH